MAMAMASEWRGTESVSVFFLIVDIWGLIFWDFAVDFLHYLFDIWYLLFFILSNTLDARWVGGLLMFGSFGILATEGLIF